MLVSEEVAERVDGEIGEHGGWVYLSERFLRDELDEPTDPPVSDRLASYFKQTYGTGETSD